ncbi:MULTISPECIES: hypothetical protein [Bradyrhizobium]|uniref:hypothetical protein n=1 Tax=Bradyrhizobium TaxID=374 RepID=UPI0020112558|nr:MULTISPECIES: hypothetical protein [Bradyrhizobium]
MIRSPMIPIAAAIMALAACAANAQGAFPAPLPGQSSAPPVSSPIPLGNGSTSATRPIQSGPAEQCMKSFETLREEAERRGNLIKAAGDRHAPPDEACDLIRSFGQAQLNMVEYVETNTAQCGIPADVGKQLKALYESTAAMRTRVCNVAQQMQQRDRDGPRRLPAPVAPDPAPAAPDPAPG